MYSLPLAGTSPPAMYRCNTIVGVKAGEVARASGRFMLATFDQAAELNDRYQLTTKVKFTGVSRRGEGGRLSKLPLISF